MFRHPAASAHWKTFESGGADVPINAAGIAGREATVGGVPVEDGLAMDVVKEGGQWVGREFVIAQPCLESLVEHGMEHRSQVRVLHPENLGKVVHLDVLLCPPVKFCGRIIVLVPGDASRCPSNRA